MAANSSRMFEKTNGSAAIFLRLTTFAEADIIKATCEDDLIDIAGLVSICPNRAVT